MSQAGGQLRGRHFLWRLHRFVENNVDPCRGLSEHSQQVAVELILSDKGSQMVRSAVSAIGNGHWLDWCFAFRGGPEQEAMERQYGQACAGGSFRVYQDILSGLQILDDLSPNASSLATPAMNEERAGLSSQPANERPLADLRFRQEANRREAPQNRNIRPADVVADEEYGIVRWRTVLMNVQSQASAGPSEAESCPGGTINGFAGNHFSDPQTGGQ